MTINLPGIPSTVQAGVINVEGLGQIPVVEMTWLDERTGCSRAHRYLAGELQGIPAEYDGCYFYRAGRCTMNGSEAGRPRNACLFHEPETGRSWARVREWRLLVQPDGSECITPAHSAPEIAHALGAVIVGAELVEVR